eukprot:CAMPEP_0196581324 /NCGR_PEP_ID=MMETSP1081-20130531/33632_1 /TAXON_ID=36882 /ORGANISM="Pyramimonas amylifera, Strain CCMP720" /LENGTH=76 /DNA_ID=CAMNT_0041901521 /DNA_START=264 /DNA_END=494 /DNA_ORIENTATION=-
MNKTQPWHKVASGAAEEEIIELCLEAIIDGDEAALQECLVEAEAEIQAEELIEAKQNPRELHEYLESHKSDFSHKK